MEVLGKYGFHDAEIKAININDYGLVMHFDDGIYNLKIQKEDTLTKPCQLIFKIKNFLPLKLYEHVEIIAYKKNKFYEVPLNRLVDTITKYGSLDVDNVYTSSFTNAVLIKGYVGKIKIDFFITEILSVEVQFLESK